MESITSLAEKATWGTLTPDEVDYVTRTFYSSTPGEHEDLANCVYILGRIGADQHRSAIEKLLYFPSDPDVSATALRVLCIYWKYTADYLDKITLFIKGVDWDDADEVRLMAFSALGKYLQKQKSFECIKLLADFVEDPTKIDGYLCNRDYAQAFLQGCACVALAEALNWPEDESPDDEAIERVIQQGSSRELVILQEAHKVLNNKSFFGRR